LSHQADDELMDDELMDIVHIFSHILTLFIYY